MALNAQKIAFTLLALIMGDLAKVITLTFSSKTNQDFIVTARLLCFSHDFHAL